MKCKINLIMDEIIKQVFTAIPQYLLNFFKLLSSPRQYPLDKLPKNEGEIKASVTEALKFILISYSLLVILNGWKDKSANVLKDLGVVGVSTLIQMSLFVSAIYLAWKIAGSTKQFFDYFVIYSYLYGMVFVIIALFGVISNGYLKIFDKELYDNLLKVKSNSANFNTKWWYNSNYQIAWGIIIIGYFIGILWGWIGWGAYRIINNCKKWKSFWVLGLASLFSWMALAISYLIINGVM